MVTGAAGMLGRAVAAEFRARGREVLGLARQELDVTDFAAVRRALSLHRPEVVVNCAAYTDVGGAGADYSRALMVNGLGPKHLALACREVGAVLVHLGTDYVFDGANHEPYGVYDPPAPSTPTAKASSGGSGRWPRWAAAFLLCAPVGFSAPGAKTSWKPC